MKLEIPLLSSYSSRVRGKKRPPRSAHSVWVVITINSPDAVARRWGGGVADVGGVRRRVAINYALSPYGWNFTSTLRVAVEPRRFVGFGSLDRKYAITCRLCGRATVTPGRLCASRARRTATEWSAQSRHVFAPGAWPECLWVNTQIPGG